MSSLHYYYATVHSSCNANTRTFKPKGWYPCVLHVYSSPATNHGLTHSRVHWKPVHGSQCRCALRLTGWSCLLGGLKSVVIPVTTVGRRTRRVGFGQLLFSQCLSLTWRSAELLLLAQFISTSGSVPLWPVGRRAYWGTFLLVLILQPDYTQNCSDECCLAGKVKEYSNSWYILCFSATATLQGFFRQSDCFCWVWKLAKFNFDGHAVWRGSLRVPDCFLPSRSPLWVAGGVL